MAVLDHDPLLIPTRLACEAVRRHYRAAGVREAGTGACGFPVCKCLLVPMIVRESGIVAAVLADVPPGIREAVAETKPVI